MCVARGFGHVTGVRCVFAGGMACGDEAEAGWVSPLKTGWVCLRAGEKSRTFGGAALAIQRAKPLRGRRLVDEKAADFKTEIYATGVGGPATGFQRTE